MSMIGISAKVLSRKSIGDEDQLCIEVAASKASTAPAFLRQIEVTDGPLGSEVLPSFWDDNSLILLPGETRELTVRYRCNLLSLSPYLMVEGWNVRPRCVSVDGSQELRLEAILKGPLPTAEGRVAFTLTQTADSRRYVTWPMELKVNGKQTVVRFAAYGKIPATAILELPAKP